MPAEMLQGSCMQSPGYDRKVAWGLQLARAEEFDTIVEDFHDSKAIIGWGPGSIVLSFRGTASMKNATTDIRVSMALHHSSSDILIF